MFWKKDKIKEDSKKLKKLYDVKDDAYNIYDNDATAENKAIFDSKVKDIDDFIYNVYSKDVYETYANDKPDLVRIRTGEVVSWGDAFGDSFEKLNINQKHELIGLIEGGSKYGFK